MLRKVQSDALTIAALLEDLEQRGILEDTLVVWGGEFGRPGLTPATARTRPATMRAPSPSGSQVAA